MVQLHLAATLWLYIEFHSKLYTFVMNKIRWIWKIFIMYQKNTTIFNWSPCTLHTWGTLDDDDLRVVVEPLGGSVDEMVEVVEAKLLVGPRLRPRLQHTARLAVDRRTRGLNIFKKKNCWKKRSEEKTRWKK